MRAVSDTSPINYLILTEYVYLLPELYDEIVIPEMVFKELTSPAAPAMVRNWFFASPEWLQVRKTNKTDPKLKLSGGEREAVLLAGRDSNGFVFNDERTGRREASQRNLAVIGTLGIIRAAADDGLLDPVEAVTRLIKTTFRASPKLLRLL